jgi:hypothetical protein
MGRFVESLTNIDEGVDVLENSGSKIVEKPTNSDLKGDFNRSKLSDSFHFSEHELDMESEMEMSEVDKFQEQIKCVDKVDLTAENSSDTQVDRADDESTNSLSNVFSNKLISDCYGGSRVVDDFSALQDDLKHILEYSDDEFRPSTEMIPLFEGDGNKLTYSRTTKSA